jgi:hypothetical protein
MSTELGRRQGSEAGVRQLVIVIVPPPLDSCAPPSLRNTLSLRSLVAKLHSNDSTKGFCTGLPVRCSATEGRPDQHRGAGEIGPVIADMCFSFRRSFRRWKQSHMCLLAITEDSPQNANNVDCFLTHPECHCGFLYLRGRGRADAWAFPISPLKSREIDQFNPNFSNKRQETCSRFL